MIPGVFKCRWGSGKLGSDGVWKSKPPELAGMLNRSFPPESESYAPPWVLAFYRAVDSLSAEVIKEPVDDPLPEDARP